MIRRISVFIMLCLCVGQSTDAQTKIFDMLNKPMYEARVKLIDEFIARFNGIEKRNGVPDDYIDRKSNILMLFDLTKFKSKQDSLFMSANEFANKVVEENVQLNYTDSCWYAKVKCQGSIAKRDVDFYLYLTVERRGENMYKWSIANAEGKEFDTSRTRKHRELFISPNDHEMSFMSLSKITDGSNRYIDDYAKDGYEADALSVFLTLVRCGQLKIKYVSDVEFVFLQVPGYIFSVKHFERESMNLGWLINSIEKCGDNHKSELLSLLRFSQVSQDVEKETANDSVVEMTVDSVGMAIVSKNPKDEFVELKEDEKVVCRFGNLLHLWLETEDVYYREQLAELFAGKDGKNCRISDSLMTYFASQDHPLSDSYMLSSYLNGLWKLKEKEKINVNVTDIKQVECNDKYFVVSCTIKVDGAMSFASKDMFYIRKKDFKISRISSQQLDKETI